MPSAQLYYEDVQPGDLMRPMREYIDQTQLMRWSVVSGNPDVTHFSLLRTRLQNGGDPSVTGQCLMALMDKALMDWAGPKAWVKKLSTQYRVWERFFDVKTFRGTVTGKREESGDHLVDLEVEVARGDGTVTVKGTATVSLPCRNGGSPGSSS
jgi:hypothetical protein